MALFSQEESKLKRGIMLLSTLAAGALLLTLGIMIILPRGEAPRERPLAKKAPRTLTPREAKVVEGEIYRPVPISQAPAATDEALLARAMDDSNARMLIQTLMEAAASENAPLKSSMLGAIARTADSARPILESELGRAASPRVRHALEEALRRVK